MFFVYVCNLKYITIFYCFSHSWSIAFVYSLSLSSSALSQSSIFPSFPISFLFISPALQIAVNPENPLHHTVQIQYNGFALSPSYSCHCSIWGGSGYFKMRSAQFIYKHGPARQIVWYLVSYKPERSHSLLKACRVSEKCVMGLFFIHVTLGYIYIITFFIVTNFQT